jgi:hypothetical protein
MMGTTKIVLAFSVANLRATQNGMRRQLNNNELERMWKETVLA